MKTLQFMSVSMRQTVRAAAAGLALSLAALPLAGPAAQAAERAAPYTFAFKDAPIAQVADEILGSTLGLTFTVDPEVTGSMSFRIDRRLTRAQLLEAFEAALDANAVAMVRDDETLLLTPRAKARGWSGVRMAGKGGGRRGGYEVVAVPLSYAAPSEVAKALEAIGPEKSVVYYNDKQGLLLLGGSGAQLQSAIETVKVFDQNGLQGTKVRWFPLANASASTLATELDRILQASGAYGATVVPMKRLNGVFVFGRTPEILDDVGGWISQLDVPSRDEAQSLWTYRPKNISAESLGKTLNSVLSGQANIGETSINAEAPTQATSETAQSMSFVASGDDQVRVGVDPESNTLLISASLARWKQIERILAEIDRRPSQILIEASILEVTLTDEFRLGVDWSVLAQSGKLKITSSADRLGIVGPTFPGFAVTFLADDIRAAVNALGSRTDVEVVSAPKIVTVANRTARLQVGDQVPIAVQSARSTSDPDAPLVTTTEYRNTGVILDVTPRISGENEVLLEISQEVSSVAKTTSSGIDSPTIQQRRMDSTLVLHDGGMVALGGLISATRNNGASGVPGLKDIPGLGLLFRSGSKDQRRTELIVLLTARIMRDAASSDGVMNELKSELGEVERRGLLPN